MNNYKLRKPIPTKKVPVPHKCYVKVSVMENALKAMYFNFSPYLDHNRVEFGIQEVPVWVVQLINSYNELRETIPYQLEQFYPKYEIPIFSQETEDYL